MLNVKKTMENGKGCFALEGRLDTVTAPLLEKELKESLDGLTELTMDFEHLEYISSAGLAQGDEQTGQYEGDPRQRHDPGDL